MSKIDRAIIYDVDLTDTTPGHNLIFVELITDSGLSGIGEIAMAYGMGAKAAGVLSEEIIKKLVLGRSPYDSRAIWESVENNTYWAAGRNLMHRGVQSAVDIALWDLKGKLTGQPIYNLLGGRTNEVIPLYANHWYGSATKPEEFKEKAKKVIDDGFKGLKFDPFRYTPNTCSPPPRPLPNQIGEIALKRVEALRDAVGSLNIYIDAHASLTLFDAIKWGKKLEDFDIAFFEEPVISFNPEETLEVKRNLHVPIAGGERLYTKQDFNPFIQQHAYDIIQPDICLAGGFTGLQEIAIIAHSKDIPFQLHNCAGPICSAASVHFSTIAPNLLIQEWFPYWEDNRYQYVHGAFENFAKEGVITAPDQPGLGITLNYKKLERFKKVEIKNL